MLNFAKRNRSAVIGNGAESGSGRKTAVDALLQLLRLGALPRWCVLGIFSFTELALPHVVYAYCRLAPNPDHGPYI
jgi:hypothetical protein